MPHTRSQGPPPKPQTDKSSFSAPSDSTLPSKPPAFDFTPKSSPHNSPPPSPPPVFQMAQRQTVHQQSTAGFTGANSPITLPAVNNDRSWQIPSYIMTAITNSCQFHGRDDEDAPAHINRLTRLCGTFNLEGVGNDARFLQVFPFSLAGRAATWLDSQPPNTFTTWAGLRDAFLAKYFPPAKASRLRDQIHSFRMEPDESYHLAWERFQTLLSRCSQHGLSDWALVEKFYNGLTAETRNRFDTSAGGHLMGKKSVAECNDLFESFAHSDIEHRAPTSSATRGVNQVGLDSSVAAALETFRKDLNKELAEIKKKVDRCEMCRGGHDTIDCPTLTLEQVEYISGQSRGPPNPFTNDNSNWRGNNFRSSGNPPGFPSGQYQNRGPGFYSGGGSGSGGQFSSGGSNQEGQLKSEGSSGSLSRIEELLSQLVVKDQVTQKTLAEHDSLLKNQDLMLKNQQSALLDLQRSVGGIARQLQEQPHGQFPGNTQTNPANQHAKAITTRSGKSLGEVVRERVEIEGNEEVEEEVELETPGKVHIRLDPASTAHTKEPQVEKSVEKQPIEVRPSPLVDHSRVPYPARLKHQKYSKEYGQFLEMFKQLKINLPFIEALQSTELLRK